MNVSDSIQGRGAAYGYQQATQPVQTNSTTAQKAKESVSPNKARLDSLKAQMQSGQPIDLHSLADSMVKKGAVIDIKA